VSSNGAGRLTIEKKQLLRKEIGDHTLQRPEKILNTIDHIPSMQKGELLVAAV